MWVLRQYRDFTGCSIGMGLKIDPLGRSFRQPCRKVNRFLPLLCILGLAAPHHWNFCSAVFLPIFISTMRPSKGGIRNARRLSMMLSLIRMIHAFRDDQRNVSELSQLSC